MIITTGENENKHSVERAKQLSQETGITYVKRNKTSIDTLGVYYNNSPVIVVLENGVRLFSLNQQAMEFHPSMGFVRAKRFLKGEVDPMLIAARVEPGDVVLDCTAGLGADAVVFAMAVGHEGHVIALESSQPLSVLLKEGLRCYKTDNAKFNEALPRVEVRHADHLEALRQMPDRSVDIVYFDPMFRSPVMKSASISPLRGYANAAGINPLAVDEACRVARKTVVLKEKKGSNEFERLGFGRHERPHSKIAYGVISVDSE